MQLSTNGGYLSTDCFVESITNNSEIRCRVATSFRRKYKEGDYASLVVFLRTSEEAQCDWNTTCRYHFTD